MCVGGRRGRGRFGSGFEFKVGRCFGGGVGCVLGVSSDI